MRPIHGLALLGPAALLCFLWDALASHLLFALLAAAFAVSLMRIGGGDKRVVGGLWAALAGCLWGLFYYAGSNTGLWLLLGGVWLLPLLWVSLGYAWTFQLEEEDLARVRKGLTQPSEGNAKRNSEQSEQRRRKEREED